MPPGGGKYFVFIFKAKIFATEECASPMTAPFWSRIGASRLNLYFKGRGCILGLGPRQRFPFIKCFQGLGPHFAALDARGPSFIDSINTHNPMKAVF
jgi:hypothetical protein